MTNTQYSNQQEPYPYRVFISYAHEDHAVVLQVVNRLEAMRLIPLWDDDIHPGTPFTDAIKGMIARSHIFMPIITKHSQTRPWVHQETGYAKALNIPILPIAIIFEEDSDRQEQVLPTEMIAQLQAISVKCDRQHNLRNFDEQLKKINLNRLVLPVPQGPGSLMEIVEWPEKRAELIARYANWVTDCNASYAFLRSQSVVSSFAIPDKNIDDPIWNEREFPTPRSAYRRYLQREERRMLEDHVRACGGKFIIEPNKIRVNLNPVAHRARLKVLKEFFKQFIAMPDKLQIIISSRAEASNLIIVGDYFLAESHLPGANGYRQTIFNFHSPTVLQQIYRFDQLFAELSETHCFSVNDTIDQLEELIAELTQQIEADTEIMNTLENLRLNHTIN